MQERSTLPQTIEIRQEALRKNIATMTVEGRRRDPDSAKIIISQGTITMVKEDGTWRLRHESWRDIGTEPDPG
jgi:hypothetical protein